MSSQKNFAAFCKSSHEHHKALAGLHKEFHEHHSGLAKAYNEISDHHDETVPELSRHYAKVAKHHAGIAKLHKSKSDLHADRANAFAEMGDVDLDALAGAKMRRVATTFSTEGVDPELEDMVRSRD